MTTLERLVQGDEPTWKLFLDTLNVPLLRRLTEMTGGDVALAEDYLGELLVMIVRATGKVVKQQPATEQKTIALLLQGDQSTWLRFNDRMMDSLRRNIGREVSDKELVESMANNLMVAFVANIRYLSTDLDRPQ